MTKIRETYGVATLDEAVEKLRELRIKEAAAGEVAEAKYKEVMEKWPQLIK